MSKKLKGVCQMFVLVGLVLASTVSELYAKPPHISFGKGTYDRTELYQETMFYAKSLGLNERVYIRINFTLQLQEQHEATLSYRLIHDSVHQVVIYVSQRIDRSSQLLAIAHELVHARQYIYGDLIYLEKNTFLWNKRDKVNVKRTGYRERPWEIEAHDVSRELKSDYNQSKRFKHLIPDQQAFLPQLIFLSQ